MSISIKDVNSENLLLIKNLLRKYALRIVKINIETGLKNPDSCIRKFFKELQKLAPLWKNLRELTLGKFVWQNCDVKIMFGGCLSVLTKLSMTTGDVLSCDYKYFQFTNLKSLTLSFCHVDSRILVPIAANLKHLQLSYMGKFDLSALEETSTTFPSLKSLKLKNCAINIANFLAKCYDSLEELEITGKNVCCDGTLPKLTRLKKLTLLLCPLNLAHLLAMCCHSLQHLKIVEYKWLRIDNLKGCCFLDLKSLQIMNGSGKNIVKFLTTVNETLESLELGALNSQIDFSMFKKIKMLKLQTIKINFEVKPVRNIKILFKNCPRLHSVTIEYGIFALMFDVMCLEDRSRSQQTLIRPAGHFSRNLLSLLSATQSTLRHLKIINRCCVENLEFLGKN